MQNDQTSLRGLGIICAPSDNHQVTIDTTLSSLTRFTTCTVFDLYAPVGADKFPGGVRFPETGRERWDNLVMYSS